MKPANKGRLSDEPVFNRRKASYYFLLKWISLAVIAGGVGSVCVHSFHYLMDMITGFLAGIQVPLPVWAVGGALLTGGIIYRLQPDAAGEGIPSYLQEVRSISSHIPFSVTFSKYFSSLATLATFGNGGVVGPLGCFCAGVVSTLRSDLWNGGRHREFSNVQPPDNLQLYPGRFRSPGGERTLTVLPFV